MKDIFQSKNRRNSNLSFCAIVVKESSAILTFRFPAQGEKKKTTVWTPSRDKWLLNLISRGVWIDTGKAYIGLKNKMN